MHKEYCYDNPFRRYENPYSQNSKESGSLPFNQSNQSGTQSQESRNSRIDEEPIPNAMQIELSVREELLTQPDGSVIIRTITERPNGYSVSERRIRNAPGHHQIIHNHHPSRNVILNPIPSFHQSNPRPMMIEERPSPQQQQRVQSPSPQQSQQPHNHGNDGMMDGLMDFFMPQRNLFDNFGPFFMFGQNPFEPLMQARSFQSRVDPFDQLLRDHVNFVRVNRGRMFDPGFITIILNNNAMNPGEGANRVPKNELSSLPITKFKASSTIKEGEEEKCPICLVEINDNEDIKRLPCKHLFHPNCIDTWLVKNSACPICKRDVLEAIHKNHQH